MQSKVLSSRIFSFIVLTGLVFFLVILFYLFFENSTSKKSIPSNLVTVMEDAVTFPEQMPTSVGMPVRLKIPSINVDAAVGLVGLTSDGKMDAPKNQDDVAWYELGTRPGEVGSAVIAGHYGVWKNGKGSVFDNLSKLQKGDKVTVEDDKGEIIYFVVRESRSYDPDADATDVFGSNDGKSHLNLITCEGDWDKAAKSYSLRLVVFTDKEF